MFVRNFYHAWRALRRTPALSAAAAVCIGIGVGANATVFSAAMSMLSRGIPGVESPDRLVGIHRTNNGACCSESSYPIYRELAEQQIFSGVEAHFPLLSITMSGRGEPERIWGQLVTPGYFEVLGVRLQIGRTFAADGGAGQPVVIADSLWRNNFGADQQILGRTIKLNNGVFTVIGVAPAAFHGPDLGLRADVWVPMTAAAQIMPQRPSPDDRTAPWLMIHARLQPGVSLGQAKAALNVLAGTLERTYPETDLHRGFLAAPATSIHPAFQGAAVNVAAISMAVVGLVLLVACANVANIVLARADGRRRETAIRAALGASRVRLLRDSMTESLVLSIAGGVIALALCFGVVKAAAGIDLPISAPLEIRIPMDLRTIAFTLALSVVSGLILGILPELRASRPDIVSGLKGATGMTSPLGMRSRNALISAQLAISVALLIVTALFVRSLANAASVRPGFRTGRMVLVDIDPRLDSDARQLLSRLRTRVAALPGVSSATYTDVAPLGFGWRAVNLKRPDDPAPGSRPIRADSFLVGPDYFRTMSIRILRGRDFRANGEGAAPVAIVNQTAARALWASEDPLGKRVARGGQAVTIVGIASDAKSRDPNEAQRPCIYVPFEQNSGRDATPFGVSLLVATAGESAGMTSVIRREIREAEPALAVSNVRTIEGQFRSALILPRLGVMLFGACGVVGIVLTCIGVFGTVSYLVAQRTREFGIRYAIGATRANVILAAIGRTGAFAFAGVGLGTAAALACSRVIANLLYGISATDPITFVAVPLVTIIVALGAAYVPARRGAAVDPAVSLRCN